jgi:hypothetical protein
MKKIINFKYIILALFFSALFTACSDDNSIEELDFTGTYEQRDQMARPAINTVFVSASDKDDFNVTLPSLMGAKYSSKFENRLLALNPGYTTNALGLDATTFSSVLATDILTVSLIGKTTFFDGTNILTGRQLSDDVIDVELLLIFGGPDGSVNPSLTSDNVSSNDIAFSSSFPYLAKPW